MEQKLIQIHPRDNVAVALEELAPGTQVCVGGASFTVGDAIPFGHKMALTDLKPGDMVYKYGSPIGHATQAVRAGAWIHSHNLKTNLEGLLEYRYTPEPSVTAQPEAAPPARRPRRARRVLVVLLVLVVLAALCTVGAWVYTGGNFYALPQRLRSLWADGLPHSGAVLL